MSRPDSREASASEDYDSDKLIQIVPESLTSGDVLNSYNPSEFGYHHGPIPNANLSLWDNYSIGLRNTGRQASFPGEIPNLGSNYPAVMSKVTDNVCHIAVDRSHMCGLKFLTVEKLEDHIHWDHQWAIQDTRADPFRPNEVTQGEEAIIRWILTGGWRRAQYLNDPKEGGDLIKDICDRFEFLACLDSEFARMRGTYFHRDSVKRRTDGDGLRVGAASLSNVELLYYPQWSDMISVQAEYEPIEEVDREQGLEEEEEEEIMQWPEHEQERSGHQQHQDWSERQQYQDWSERQQHQDWSERQQHQDWSERQQHQEWSGHQRQQDWSGRQQHQDWSGQQLQRDWSGHQQRQDWSGHQQRQDWSGRQQQQQQQERLPPIFERSPTPVPHRTR